MTILVQAFLVSLACLAAGLTSGCVSQSKIMRAETSNVAVNGHKLRMILDTGAGSTVLYDSTAKKMNLPFTQPPPRSTEDGPFQIVTGMSSPAQVTAGAQQFTCRMPIYILPPFSTPEEDGIIGWPEIRDDILVFDGASHELRGAAQVPPETSAWLKFQVRPHDTLLLEAPMDDGHSGVILVDTGAPGGLELAAPLWQKLRTQYPQAQTTIIDHSTATRSAISAEGMIADEVSLGPLKLTHMPVETLPAAESNLLAGACPDAEVAGVIGLDGLTRINLVVDGPNHVAYLQARPNAYGTAPQNWTVADSVRLNSDNLYVRSGIDEWAGGNHAGAMENFTRALTVNPNNADAYADRAEVFLSEGDIGKALSDETRALELAPHNSRLYASRAIARQLAGDYAGAAEDYDKEIEINSAKEAWLHREVLCRRLGRPSEDFVITVGRWKPGWMKSLGEFMDGTLDETGLLAVAHSQGSAESPKRECEAYYFIGMKRLIDGDGSGAKVFLQKSVDTGVRNYAEYQFSVAELNRLNKPVAR